MSRTLTLTDPRVLRGFVAGTRIDTMQGVLRVEEVQIGMALRLPDGSGATVMWRRSAPVHWDMGTPLVAISKDAIAPGQPSRDLVLPGQQRVLVGQGLQWRDVAGGPALLPAQALVGQPGIRAMIGTGAATCVHLACRAHHVISVQGCLTDTLLLDHTYLRSLHVIERLRLAAQFPPLPATGTTTLSVLNGPPAMTCLTLVKGRRVMGAIRADV